MKILTFAIAKGGTGKTLITSNVAAALSERNKKVLLIDADAGSKSLTYLLNVTPKNTLLKVYNENKPISEAITKTYIPNVDLLTIGDNLSNYMGLDLDVLDKLNNLNYDYIIIDAPSTSSGVETYLSLGLSDYFIPILDYTAFSPSLQGAINTIVIGKNYLEAEPVGFIINKAENIPETVIKDIEKILNLKCLVIIPKMLVLEQAYERKIISYLDKNVELSNYINIVVDYLESLKDIKYRKLPKVLDKIKESAIF